MIKRLRLARVAIYALVLFMPFAVINASELSSHKLGYPEGTPANGLNEMDVIFIGKAATIEEPKDVEGFFVVTFEASKYYKGDRQASVVVRTPKEDKDYGYDFKKDEIYLVYAKFKDGALFTDNFTRTRDINHANSDGDINTLNLLVYGNREGGIPLKTDDQKIAKLDPRLRDVIKADAAFAGEVLKIEPSKGAPGMIDVTLRVLGNFSVWRFLDPEVIVRTPQDAKSGGFDFTTSKDKYYIIYADYRNGVLYTDNKSRSKDFDKAGPDGDLDILYSTFAYGMQAYGKDLAELGPMNRRFNDQLPSAAALWGEVKKLVLSNYPKAEFIIKKDYLIFEYKPRFAVLGDVTSVGEGFSHVKIVKAPQKDGIVGTISLVYDPHFEHYVSSGWINYKTTLWSREFSEGKLLISVKEKGSRKYSCYVHLTLTSPLGSKPGIQEPLLNLIDNFESYLGK